MNIINIKDKQFKPFIPKSKIESRVAEIGATISHDFKNDVPVIVGVLNGAFLFAADLVKNISIHCEISFIRLSSYDGTASTGNVKNILGLNQSLKDRRVIVVEDIVDTGDTYIHLVSELKKLEPAEIRFASLLLKPKALKHAITLDYVGFEVPNDFLVGYGLDYDGLGRNLNDIYSLV